MPAYYDEKTKTWFCKFYYTDYTGTRKQKKKRGFKLQREAKEWERVFLSSLQYDDKPHLGLLPSNTLKRTRSENATTLSKHIPLL